MERNTLNVMMLQIHRSDTPSIDVVIDRFATTAAWRPDFLIRTYYTCTSITLYIQYTRQFPKYRYFKYIILHF